MANRKIIPELTSSQIERYLSKVSVAPGEFDPEECIEWLGTIDRSGYGVFGLQGKVYLAHRISYWIFYGFQPPELDHICGNKSCISPFHLDSVSHKENVRRACEKSHCSKGHELTDENRYGKNRECRICCAATKLAWQRKNRDTGELRGGQWRNRTSCSKGHLYTPASTRIYKGRRYCRPCQHLRYLERAK